MVYPNCKYIVISVGPSQDNDLFKDVNLSCLFFKSNSVLGYSLKPVMSLENDYHKLKE